MGDLLYYNYAADGLLAVTTLPAIFFATAGFCLVRRQRDAARYGFGFFKAAMVFYAMYDPTDALPLHHLPLRVQFSLC